MSDNAKKSTPDKVRKAYNKSHTDMEIQAQTFIDHAEDNQAALEAADGEITSPWLEDLQNELDEAMAATSPEASKTQLKLLHSTVKAEMALARKEFKDLTNKVKKTFANDNSMQEAYGSKRYGKVRNSPLQFAQLLELVFGLATTDHVALVAHGYTEGKITALHTRSGSLLLAEQAHEKKKGSIGISDEDYITKHNNVWTKMQTISNAAKQAFSDDYALYNIFLLYGGGTLTYDEITIEVPSGMGVSLTLDIPLTENQRFSFKLMNDTTAKVDLTDAPNFYSTNGVNLPFNTEITRTGKQIRNPIKPNVTISCTSDTANATVRVRIYN